MQFTVPKFIEREARIIGPITFKQFLILSIPFLICLYFYFTAPFSIFLLSLFIFGGGGIILAFWKVKGIPLATVIKNFFKFSISPKVFIWKKEEGPIFLKEIRFEEKEKLPIKLTEESKIKRAKIKVETKK